MDGWVKATTNDFIHWNIHTHEKTYTQWGEIRDQLVWNACLSTKGVLVNV